MAKKEFPEWVKILYRGVRAGVAGGIGAVTAMKLVLDKNIFDLETVKVVGIVFLGGFLTSFGMWLRDFVDDKFGWKPTGVVQRTMPI